MSTVKEWRETRLKNLFTSVRNGIWGDDPDDETDVFCARGTDFDRTTNRISAGKMPRRSVTANALRDHQLQHGDLVLEKSGGSADQPVGSVALFDLQINAVCSNFNARVQVSGSVDSPFACYLMNSLYWSGFTRQFVKQTTGIQNLDAQALLAQRCTLPPLDEQRRIADFLDAETARIDALTAAREQQLSLVDERLEMVAKLESGRAAVRKTAILPDGWRIQQLRRVTGSIKTGTTPTTSEAGFWAHGGNGDDLPWYGPSSIKGYLSVEMPVKHLFRDAVRERVATRFPRGSVLIVGIGATAGKVAHLDHEASGNQQLTAIAPSQAISSRFLAWQLWAAANEIRELAPYTTLPIINNDFLKSFPISVPPASQQQVIARRLDGAAESIRALKEATARASALAAERRQALITAAVTGQIDVTTARGVSLSGGVAV